ncbi:MAG: hypothetical protein FJ267_02205 [Planctomycetes bacterium]|nr:hypothetical protein [Planctomycetota bacterium]
MTIGPLSDDIEIARPVFRKLREFRDSWCNSSPLSCDRLRNLSIGMSADFEIGIEEGATIIRVGSCLFEGLSKENDNP